MSRRTYKIEIDIADGQDMPCLIEMHPDDVEEVIAQEGFEVTAIRVDGREIHANPMQYQNEWQIKLYQNHGLFISEVHE